MEKLVIYYRISSGSQDSESQLEDLKTWAKVNNYEVDRVFGETVSGYDISVDREELDNMKSYVIKSGIKTVLVWELSRLGRSTLQTLQHIEFFSSQGVNIIFKKENLHTLTDDFTKKLVISLLSSVAEMERNTLMERVKRGRDLAARKGKRVGYSTMPLGFTADENGFIKVDEEEAKIIKEIYESIARGISALGVTKSLNARGILTQRAKSGKEKVLRNGTVVPRRWSEKTIKNMVRSVRYKGYRNYADLTLPLPRIISDELWNEANERLNQGIGYISRTKWDYLFKSKIICGHCGYTIRNIRKFNRKKQSVLYYSCVSYLKTKNLCSCGQFKQETFDNNAYKILFEQSRGLVTLVRQKGSAQIKSDLQKQISYWNGIKGEAEKEKNRVVTLFKKGFISEEEIDKDYASIVKKTNEADSEILRLSGAVANIETPDDITMETMKHYYWTRDFATKRAFVEEHIQKIKAYKVKEIGFNLGELEYTEYEDRGDNKITVMKRKGFKSPERLEPIWYLEIYAFKMAEPIKAVMSSWGSVTYANTELKYNRDTETLSLG